MLLKRILKKCINFFGIDIVRLNNPVPDVPEINVPERIKSEGELREIYYIEEGRRFEWLKEYNFRTIIDIGANEGQFAGRILSVLPDAEIHCFEPLQDVYQQLKSNFRERQNVVLYNCGLGSEEGEKEIFKNEHSPSSSLLEMLELHKANFGLAVEVEAEKILIRRLDEVFPNEIIKPLLIKIDVQGYEKYVLEGGESVILQADVIIIETTFFPLYDKQPLFEDIYNYFIKIGFRYIGNVEQLIAPTDQKILQADAVFEKKFSLFDSKCQSLFFQL